MFVGIVFLILITAIIYYNKKSLPVLLYHDVNDKSKITPEIFEEHITILKSLGMNFLTIAEVKQKILEGKKVDKNSVVITFDDGYRDNYDIAYQILKKHGVKATIYLNSAYIKDKRENNINDFDSMNANFQAVKNFFKTGNLYSDNYMTWDEIKEMQNSGLIDIGLHTHSHKAVFSSTKIVDFVNKNLKNRNVVFAYDNNQKEEFPIFKMRGETAAKKIMFTEEILTEIQSYHNEELINLKKKEKAKLANKFIKKYLKENNNAFYYESDEAFEARIKEEMLKNINTIEEKTGIKPDTFAWPWGHSNKDALKIMKSIGITSFATCKKGANPLKVKIENIRRNELKNRGIGFKFMIYVLRNRFTSKLYEFIT